MGRLANKYRPATFEDVSDQDVIITILKKQLENNDIKNAYLFHGGAGTGKTTCARIFANEILKGEGEITEIDGATNNGVENIREIIEDSKFFSVYGNKKIYIIDECQALSGSAWSSLLKILEETTENVVFIFCTTDIQKIPETILTRVQRFNFKGIGTDFIVKRLEYICENEKVNYTKTALEYIAKRSKGGMREAISKLEYVLAFTNNTVDLYNTMDLLNSGITDYDLHDLTMHLIDKNLEKSIKCYRKMRNTGVNAREIAKKYFDFLLDVQIYILLDDVTAVKTPKDILKDYKIEHKEKIRTYIQKLYVLINEKEIPIDKLFEAWVVERCI